MTQSGVLADHQIRALIDQGVIRASHPVQDGQIQPASLDLRLGAVAYRVRASFLA
ncbi:MAG: 2'-deoxycytidine 5'-triphosphate deaminase, partial [Octadecabacter sp.]